MKNQLPLFCATLLLLAPALAEAAEAMSGEVKRQPLNWSAIIMFFIFVLATLGITYWAARRTRSAKDFYAAGGGITGLQNGLAIAGDYMSAASFLGTAGLPHILMRFFTVADARAARKSVFYATGFIGYFYILTFIIGFGAIMLVLNQPEMMETVVKEGKPVTQLIGGNNMTAIHLAEAVGGNLFLGFISAVAFATILAVVAGLALSGASAVSHDLYASVIKKGNAKEADEIRVSKITTVILGLVAIVLGIAFEKQNIAFMVGGLISAVSLIVVGPTVWVDVLKHKEALFPYKNPALFSITLAFLTTWLFSVTDSSARAEQEKQAFAAQFVRAMTGIGASGPTKH